jgi:hypothetical protein
MQHANNPTAKETTIQRIGMCVRKPSQGGLKSVRYGQSRYAMNPKATPMSGRKTARR